MLQAIFEKCADWLLPLVIGISIWYGVHYLTLAPRIIAVDQKSLYSNFNSDKKLPANIEACVKENITAITLEIARLEAALYTATLKHISEPYRLKYSEIDKSLDSKCGISKARKVIKQKAAPQEIKREIQNNINMWMEIFKEFSQ